MKRERRCEDGKSQSKDLDIISTLPEPILETILGFLPTIDAARTSILSREWRYKWIKISKLWFRLSHVQGKNKEKASKPIDDLLQILLSHQGPIHDFILEIDTDCDSFGLDQIILHLSKNHRVRKLTLDELDDSSWHKLPISVFSLHHLTNLELSSFVIDHEQILTKFGSLRSLVLDLVNIPSKSLVHLLTNCPSLKQLTMDICGTYLSDRDCNIIQLFECLPKVEHLTMNGFYLKFQWPLTSVPQELPALFNLKYFCFKQMHSVDGHGLTSLLVLIKCSPNLEKIKLEIAHSVCYEYHSIVWEKYSDVWLEHLNELDIQGFSNREPDIEFVKFILARSPKLKKVSIRCSRPSEKKMEMLDVLLQTPRVSPVIIIVK